MANTKKSVMPTPLQQTSIHTITIAEDELGITAVEVTNCINPLCPIRLHERSLCGYAELAKVFGEYASEFMMKAEEEGEA